MLDVILEGNATISKNKDLTKGMVIHINEYGSGIVENSPAVSSAVVLALRLAAVVVLHLQNILTVLLVKFNRSIRV